MGEKRVALVTGGAKRVGRAIVERLGSAGFEVIFTRHTSPPDPQFASIEVDLSSPSAGRTILRQVARLDVLVNNASLYEPGDDPELARRLTAVNVSTPVSLIREFAPTLRASRGHVVNILDILAERPWPKYAAYCASKAALWNYTLSLARELAPDVTINGIAPGVVAWPEDVTQEFRDRYIKRVPLARAGTPQDVANLVHFLVTEGTYITGQVIRLDGGRSLT